MTLQNYITNLENMNCANSASIKSMMTKTQVQWTGYVNHNDNYRNGTKTKSKLTFAGARSDQRSQRNVILTNRVGTPLTTKTLQTSKKHAIIFRENSTTVQFCHWSLPHILLQYPNSACPDLVCGTTSGSIDELQDSHFQTRDHYTYVRVCACANSC